MSICTLCKEHEPNLNNSYRSKTVPLFYIKLNFG